MSASSRSPPGVRDAKMNEEPKRARYGTPSTPNPVEGPYPLERFRHTSQQAPLPLDLDDPLQAELLAAESFRAPLARGHLARLQVLRSNALRAREFGRLTIEMYAVQVLLLAFLAMATWVLGYSVLSHGDAPPPKPFVGKTPGSSGD